MKNSANIDEQFFTLSEELFGDLRMLQSISPTRVEQLVDCVTGLAEKYEKFDVIPKNIAGELFDVSTALYSAIDAYPEPQRQLLYGYFDSFCDSARSVFHSA